MVEIREMRIEDLEQVAQIEKEIFTLPWSAKGFEDSLKQEYTCYLTAWQDGVLAGYCGFLQSFDEADITNVAVQEKYRGQGIAFWMLSQLMQQGEKRGVTAFTLEVREGNQAARRLYQKLGFEEAGIRKNFYEKPTEDAVIMWKR